MFCAAAFPARETVTDSLPDLCHTGPERMRTTARELDMGGQGGAFSAAGLGPRQRHRSSATMLSMSKKSGDDTATALVHAYLECPNCGRIPKPTTALLVLPGADSEEGVHCRMRCDQCGSDAAMLYLRREIMPRH